MSMGLSWFFLSVVTYIVITAIAAIAWLTKPIKIWSILFYVYLVVTSFAFIADIDVTKWGATYAQTKLETIELAICMWIAFMSMVRVIAGVIATHMRYKNKMKKEERNGHNEK